MIAATQVSPNLTRLGKGILKDPVYFDQSAPTPPKIIDASAVSFKGRVDMGSGKGSSQSIWIASFIHVDVPLSPDTPDELEPYLKRNYIASFSGGKLGSYSSEIHVTGDYASTWILVVDWMIGA